MPSNSHKACVLVLTMAAMIFGSWQDAPLQAADPGQAKPPDTKPALIKPTSGVAQSPIPRAVCTFQSIGLYWTPEGGAEDKACRVSYRISGEAACREALPLWFDARIGEYRGSIVQLPSGKTWEIRLSLPESGAAPGPSAELKATTWAEEFPIARTVYVDDMNGRTLVPDESGTPQGYILYTHRAAAGVTTATIDGAGKVDHCIEVKASYIILRGLTLRGPKIHGIALGPGAHDVVIERCDISGWGRTDKDGFGVDYDSAIYSKSQSLSRIVVQRNRFHHPRSNSNSWQEFREGGERYHPKGPQAICFWESAGNHVLRYNEFTTDDNHYCNDIFGAGNNRSLRGFPGTDSDVYGNGIEGCWDDGLEMEGGGCNVRVWGNYIDRTFVKIAIAGLSVGPIYIFRNVAGASRLGHTSWRGEPFLKMGGAPLTGGGRAYIFHNTILQPPAPPDTANLPGGRGTVGCEEGVSQSGGPELLSIVSRNNIFHVRQPGNYSIRDASQEPTPEYDYDFDLFNGKIKSAGNKEPHGILGLPVYAANRAPGDFSLAPSSPGFDAGVRLANFNDDFKGKAPDIGAFEAGGRPMEFGVDAHLKRGR